MLTFGAEEVASTEQRRSLARTFPSAHTNRCDAASHSCRRLAARTLAVTRDRQSFVGTTSSNLSRLAFPPSTT